MGAKQILIGTVSGLVAGATVALLLAPQSGKETRQQLVDSADTLKKKLAKFKKKSEKELDDLKGVFSQQVEGLSDDVREKVLALIDESKESYQSLKADLHDED